MEKTIPRVRTMFNASQLPTDNEPGGGRSMTVPDMAMGMKEIMARYTRNLPIDGVKSPQYEFREGDEDYEGIEPEKMDKLDLLIASHEAKAQMEQINEELKERGYAKVKKSDEKPKEGEQ
ncbi:hypothetical protein [Apis mellifera associated microvirus 59]|nr:hypothetical protein [Apis mellifera associated microvirus 59]